MFVHIYFLNGKAKKKQKNTECLNIVTMYVTYCQYAI